MGNKKLKNDIHCCYCGRKYNYETEKELGNIDGTIVGDILYCSNPKCEQQSVIKEK